MLAVTVKPKDVDSKLLNLVTDVLSDFTKNKKIFSAFDITKECRTKVNRLTKDRFFVDHSTVRDLVHEIYDSELPPFENGSDYVRENFSYSTNGVVAFQVFRPIDISIDTYNPSEVKVEQPFDAFIPSNSFNPNAAKGATVFNPLPPNPITTSVNIIGAKQVLRATSRSRINVPAEYIKQINLGPGDEASIHYTDEGIEVEHIVYPCDLSLTVDKNGSVRIPKCADSYTVEVKDNVIYLKRI